MVECNSTNGSRRIRVCPKNNSSLTRSDVPSKKSKKIVQKRKKRESQQIAKKFQGELLERATAAEREFKNIMERAGVSCKFQNIMRHTGSFSIVDFFLPQYNAVIEIDGGYHDTPEQSVKDAERTLGLMKKNRVACVIRFKNEDVFKGDEWVLSQLAKKLIPWAPQVRE